MKRGLNISKLMQVSYSSFVKNWKKILVVCALAHIPVVFAYSLLFILKSFKLYLLVMYLPVIYPAAIIMTVIMSAAISYAGYISYTGGNLDVDMVFKKVFSKIFRYTVAVSLAALLIFAGTLLLVIPGIYAMTILMFSGLAALVESDDVKTLSFSSEIAKGSIFKITLIVFIISIPFLFIEVIQLLNGKLPSGAIAFYLGILFSVCYSCFITVLLGGMYVELKKSAGNPLKNRKTAARLKGANDNLGCVIILIALFCLLILAGIAGGIYFKRIYSGHDGSRMTPMCGNNEPVLGKKVIRKEQIWQDEYLDVIYEAALTDKGKVYEGLVITSDTKALYIDKNLKVKRTVDYYQQMCRPVKPICHEGDNNPIFFKYTTNEKYVVVMNSEGERRFAIANDNDTRGYSACGDINGDGKYEFVVNFEDKKKLGIFDDEGKKITELNQPAVGQVYIVENDIDGLKKLLFRDNKGQLMMCSDSGVVLSKFKPVSGEYHFYPVVWFGGGTEYVMIPQNEKIGIFKMAGNRVAEIADADVRLFQECASILYKGKSLKEYFTVLAKSYGDTILTLYDKAGVVVYKEKMKGYYRAILQYGDGFIVAGEGKIYRYTEK